jgi:O-antigen/teichoic acid export membrane protein
LTVALVPLSLKYLGTLQYGIWATLSSIVFWLSYLDFGIGNGLRNKVSESLACGDTEKARRYISTAYMIFSAGAVITIVILTSASQFVDWVKILKAPEGLRSEINLLIFFLFVLFVIQLLLKLINAVINGDQKPALNGFISLMINLFTIIAVYSLLLIGKNSLLNYGIAVLCVPVFVLTAISIIVFYTIYKNIAPAKRFVDYKLSKDLLNLGLQFFVIQIAGLIIFSAQNIIITQFLGPEEVTIYNVAYRYFSLITLVFGVILTPLWSAFTDAYVKQDFDWIRKAMKKILFVWGALSVEAILMVLISNYVYLYWVGATIKVPFILSAALGVYVILVNWSNVFGYFLNGAGKIRLQFYWAIVNAVVYIALIVLFF